MNVLDLFSGIGGFSLGLERAGMRTVGFCEIDPYCRAVLRKHWPSVPIFEDIRSLDATRLAELGHIDVICGGFPCQPFSIAGVRKGKQDDRNLWPEMFRIVSLARPAWVIAENVTGLITLALDDVLTDLEGAGYATRTLVIPAAGVGAPHRRDRLWIIATDANREHVWNDQQRQARRWDDVQDSGQTKSADDGAPGNVADPALLFRPAIERDESDGTLRSGQALADADDTPPHADVADSDRSERRPITEACRMDGRQCISQRDEGPDRSGGSRADVANADGNAGHEWRSGDEQESEGRRDTGRGREREDDVADASGARPSVSESSKLRRARRREEGRAVTQCDWWTLEPSVGRMAHGIPRRVDRLRTLGNAVVPQIPQIIGEAIMMQTKE